MQTEFTLGRNPGFLLQRLHDYIEACDAVICLIGRRSGEFPPEAEQAAFARLLPSGVPPTSYTQWEFHFAERHGKPLYVFIADAAYTPDDDALNDDHASQRAHIDRIKARGLDRKGGGTADALRATVMREQWPDRRRGRPSNLPYPALLDDRFIGRGASLDAALQSAYRRPPASRTVVAALTGLFGVGKTRTAVEYAHRNAEYYEALLFVPAQSPDILLNGLADLAKVLPLGCRRDEPRAPLKDVRDWLNANPRWLLILDGVNTVAARDATTVQIGNLWGGHVVITTQFATHPNDIRILRLDMWPRADAVKFLLAGTDKRQAAARDDEAMAGILARELGGLPLALEHARAYINATGIGFAGYLHLRRTNDHHLRSRLDPHIIRYPRSIECNWELSFHQLDDAGRLLLQWLALFAPAPIPNFLLDVPPLRATPAKARAAPDKFKDALSALADCSFVTRNAVAQTFTVHPVVRDITQCRLCGEKPRILLAELRRWITDVVKRTVPGCAWWPGTALLALLAPHATMIGVLATAVSMNAPVNRLEEFAKGVMHEHDVSPELEEFLAPASGAAGEDIPGPVSDASWPWIIGTNIQADIGRTFTNVFGPCRRRSRKRPTAETNGGSLRQQHPPPGLLSVALPVAEDVVAPRTGATLVSSDILEWPLARNICLHDWGQLLELNYNDISVRFSISLPIETLIKSVNFTMPNGSPITRKTLSNALENSYTSRNIYIVFDAMFSVTEYSGRWMENNSRRLRADAATGELKTLRFGTSVNDRAGASTVFMILWQAVVRATESESLYAVTGKPDRFEGVTGVIGQVILLYNTNIIAAAASPLCAIIHTLARYNTQNCFQYSELAMAAAAACKKIARGGVRGKQELQSRLSRTVSNDKLHPDRAVFAGLFNTFGKLPILRVVTARREQ